MKKKRRFVHWWLASALVVTGFSHSIFAKELPTAKPEEVGVSPVKVEKLSRYMKSLVDDGRIAGGVTMMARHGKVVHFEAVGMADREKKEPMQKDAIFRLASMTKPITTVAAMMLWDDGKLKLDDPVSKYIPEFVTPEVLVSGKSLDKRPAKREITIRHLLTHTSGIGYNFTPKIGPIYDKHNIHGGLCEVTEEPLGHMVKRLAVLPLLFDPGDKWEYGMSTDVLGRVIEVASKMPLDCFVAERICRPLGMTDTFFKAPAEKRSRLPAVYAAKDGVIVRLEDGEAMPTGDTPDYPYHDSHKFLSGGGGLCSTASDYMRFCQMLLGGGVLNGNRLLSQEAIKMMTMHQVGDVELPHEEHRHLAERFGFGVTIFPNDEDVHEQLHDAYAWFGFWSTSFRISPNGDWILITMSQLAWDDPATPTWFAEYEEIAAESIIDKTASANGSDGP